MSEIIRDAIIRLKLETQRSRIEMPEVDKISRSYEEQRIASEQVRTSVENTQTSVKEAAETNKRFGVESARAFKDGLEGAIQLTRGMALMSAASEEDTRKLLEMFAKIEAATALTRGVINLGKFAEAFGPIGIAVGLTTAAVGVGVAAWQKYRAELEETKRKADELEDAIARVREETRQSNEALNRRFGGASVDVALGDRERANRLEQERIRSAQEYANIKQEQMGSSWGKFLRGLTKEQRQEQIGTLASVNPEEATKQRNIEQRLFESAEYQKNVVKEQAENAKKLLDTVQTNQYNLGTAAAGFAATTPGFGGFAALGAATTVNQQASQFDAVVAKVLGDAQQSLDKFVALMRDAAERIREFDDALRAQGAANPK